MARRIGHDVTVFSISGTDVKALFRDGSVHLSADEIDLSAALDDWAHSRTSLKHWEITCTKLIDSAADFMDMLVTGGTVAVTTDMGGKTFAATGVLVDNTTSTGQGEETEAVTIRGYGDEPTIT